MNEDEAERAASELRRQGLRGVAGPLDPDHPEGEWRVFDGADPATRREITDATVHVRRVGPRRGFVLPSNP